MIAEAGVNPVIRLQDFSGPVEVRDLRIRIVNEVAGDDGEVRRHAVGELEDLPHILLGHKHARVEIADLGDRESLQLLRQIGESERHPVELVVAGRRDGSKHRGGPDGGDRGGTGEPQETPSAPAVLSLLSAGRPVSRSRFWGEPSDEHAQSTPGQLSEIKQGHEQEPEGKRTDEDAARVDHQCLRKGVAVAPQFPKEEPEDNSHIESHKDARAGGKPAAALGFVNGRADPAPVRPGKAPLEQRHHGDHRCEEANENDKTIHREQ